MATDNFGVPYGTAFRTNERNWYKVIQHIGKGGNGTVFLVNSTGGEYQGGIFAMKVFHKMSSQKRKTRFLEEIAFMKEQHHPSIMRQYDDGVYLGHPFVVMEYIPNTLENEIRKGAIDITRGLIYSTQLLSSIKHLHGLGKIHRDIKPGNIFVNNSSAILGDFGLIADSAMNDTDDNEDVKGYIAMPRYYRTPELVKYAKNESPLRIESDIFQLGLVFAYMFSGKNPLKASANRLDDLELDNITLPKESVSLI